MVTNLSDGGAGSLRYEIAQAQSGDTITFEGKLKGGTITLFNGELDINKNLTIQGPGAGLLTVTSESVLANQAPSRIFEMESSVTNATLSGMTIRNGGGLKSSYGVSDSYDGAGGGVLNLGTLTISNCTLTDNFAHVYSNSGYFDRGGAVASFGTLTVSGCTLSNNNAFGNGGAIFNGGTLKVSGCTLSANYADNGGGIYNNAGCTLTVSSCTLSDNSAYSGGGIDNAGTLTVSNTTFTSNTPDNIYGPYTDGGGNTFTHSTLTVINLSDNGPGSLRFEIAQVTSSDNTIVFDNTVAGQTITLTTGELVISQSLTIKGSGETIASRPYVNDLFESENGSRIFEVDGAGTTVALSGLTLTGGGGTQYGGPIGQPYDGYGGAILNFGTLTLSNCSLGTDVIGSGSDAQYGGAIANFGTLTVSGCYVQNNSAFGYEGGGIYNAGTAAALTVLDSVFSHNSPDNIYGPYTDGGGNTFN
jgi:hypothetical protein